MSRKKQNISYVKPEEPAFLKRIKEQLGYKEKANIDTKRQRPEFNEDGDDDETERECDKPQVVVLKEGDIGEEELAKFEKEKAEEDEKKKIEEGQIKFKKPIKRQTANEGNDDPTNVSSTKKTKIDDSKREKLAATVKAVDDNRLLSFALPDDDEDD